ncbi:hypothetical protein [Aquimarina agarilytica]|uniref:hypothetical protein n=1 Tax=Aquimarina agarilytica TaxID=1087449 RepID=UPI001E3F8DCF|nr:hypothetical protein [Aquimarina agarilytica]
MATIKFILQSKTVQSAIYLRLSLNRKEVFKRKTGLDIDFGYFGVTMPVISVKQCHS